MGQGPAAVDLQITDAGQKNGAGPASEHGPFGHPAFFPDIPVQSGGQPRLVHRFEASIIYVTGHAGFALDSFPTRPLDYLLKPVNEARLAAALDWDIRMAAGGPSGYGGVFHGT